MGFFCFGCFSGIIVYLCGVMMKRIRYDILDGLRGVAAMMVLLYHVFNDAKCFYVAPVYELFHGFLGVDFFFILSGFVMGYAYDGRLRDGMTFGSFAKRRLIRLHPMVVMGVLLGLVAFVIQGCVKWDGTPVSTDTLTIAVLLALLLIPSPTDIDVRGFTEAFPLNGPHWSLFFEYIGSVLYGLLLHRLPTRWIAVWVGCSIASLTAFAVLQADGGIAYGWSSQPVNLLGGALRMLYAYPMGLLMARIFVSRSPRPLCGHVFLPCSLALISLLAMPMLGGKSAETVYQLGCTTILFPTIVWVGARGMACGWRQRVVSFLGRLSYPLYAVHFPLIYLYISWVGRDGHPYEGYCHPWTAAAMTIASAIVLATLCLLLYDEPMRKWLGRKSG